MSKHRASVARVAAVALLALSLPQCKSAGAGTDRPMNVVFLLVDDLGWTDLGCFGSSFYETPNIDALAARGMQFTAAYAAGPVCSPTRASILAGKYPARMDTTDYFGGSRKQQLLPAPYIDRLPLDEVTLAESFRAAGYRTAFLGKWHLGGDGFGPEQQGFDLNVGGYWSGHPRKGYFAPYDNPALADGPDGEYLTDRLTEEALAFLDSARHDPFFLYLSYYTVHTPLQARQELIARYRQKQRSVPQDDGPRFLPEGEREARQVQDHAVYAAMVHALDDSVGRVLGRLADLGVGDRTVVVLFSDNGGLSTSEGSPTSNVPLRAGKGWLYEGGIRVPLIVAAPGITAPQSRCEDPVISTDFYPTLLEATGLPIRPTQHQDGRSLVPLLAGAMRLPERPLFWHYPHYGNQGGSPGGAVRLGRFKLIEWFEGERVELYDLLADPSERNDLAESMPAKVVELRGLLHDWRREVDAKMPTPNPAWRGGVRTPR